VGDQSDPTITWKLHVGQGQLHYAHSPLGEQERLSYLLPRIHPKLNNLTQNMPRFGDVSAYEWLCQAWQTGKLSLSTLRTILQALSQEALGKMLAIENGVFHFDRAIGIDPILIAVPFKAALPPITKTLRTWQQLYPQITSPFQRLGFAPGTTLPETSLQNLQQQVGPEATAILLEALEHQPCFYQLAANLDLRVTALACMVHPLIQAGYLTLHPYANPPRTNRPTIACIDDSNTIQQMVKVMLEGQGYEVLNITNPLQAVETLTQAKPDLVFLDITMPHMDGYNLCRLLRQCEELKETPIVMLTGRDTMVDKVRARLLGATSYVTKPFNMHTLTNVVTRYVMVEPPRTDYFT
jgi:twitching motility two-component system response regulator PilG